MDETWSTPAVVASDISNYSTLVERSLLSSAYAFVIFVNAAANSGVDECTFHCAVLLLYSFKIFPSIHLKFWIPSAVFVFATGGF